MHVEVSALPRHHSKLTTPRYNDKYKAFKEKIAKIDLDADLRDYHSKMQLVKTRKTLTLVLMLFSNGANELQFTTRQIRHGLGQGLLI